jgi:hypothetical protein
MSTPLPPTVHERLARCGERVFVDGLVAGATVELHVDGTVLTQTASGSRRTFTVPPLNAGATVRARQDTGSGFTPFSPPVVVEEAFVPPEAGPSLPEVIGPCSQCVFVTHATPGASLELRTGGDLVGQGLADRHGNACIGLDIRRFKGEAGVNLLARQVVCGAPGPDTARALAQLPALPKPTILDPIFGCQNRVPVSEARPGGLLTFETDGGDDLGTVCTCWSRVDVLVNRALAVGERVHTRSLYDADVCEEIGPWSDWREVVAPDERIRPEILEAVVEGDQVIRVANQIAGATLLIRIAPAEGLAADEFGPRATSEEQEIALAAPLAAGNIVSVVQTLCGVSMESEPVTVQPLPPEILAPVVVPPMFACGQAVQVSNLHPGALVRVFLDGVPIGQRWAGLQNSISVPAAPALVAGRKVTAIQWVGGIASPESAGVIVQPLEVLHPPRVLGPVALGDQFVWVSGVTPGAHVSILSGGPGGNIVIGEADAAEPVVRVPIGPLVGPILANAVPMARLCDRTVTGKGVVAVRSPCSLLFDFEVAEQTVDLGDFAVPAVADGGGFTLPLRGQLYVPQRPRPTPAPLVIIAHGWHPGYNLNTGDPVESFKGYGYLAHHLARWGMVVFSVDLQQVNDRSGADLQQFARAEIILRVITELQANNLTANLVNADRVGLVGHSMAAEAVALAHFLNSSENRGFGIRGVVSIAPTRWHPEVVLPAGRYMEIFGSLDQLTTFLPADDVPGPSGGMRIYDRAERTKTLFWIYGLSHNPFNSLWVAAGDFAEETIRDLALPEAEHRRAAKCLINAFFQDTLFTGGFYHGYMEGTVLPQSVRHLEIHPSYSTQPRDVLDNFGDADAQAGLAAEAPLDRAVNSLGQAAAASGAGLGDWEDAQHSTIPNSPHSTAGVRLSWKRPPATYRSEAGGIARVADDALALRLAQFFEDDSLNPIAVPADLFVEVSDGGGDQALVRLGAVAQVPYPDATGVVLSMMRTVRLPLDAFQAANPLLDLTDIRSVTLRFAARPTGHILGDDFEFSA